MPAQASLGGAGHYPDRYHQIVDQLSETSAGTLVLIGSGVLAEHYCEVVKAAGGVSVDIGSSFDVLARARTRVWDQTDEMYAPHYIVEHPRSGDGLWTLASMNSHQNGVGARAIRRNRASALIRTPRRPMR